jgi:hypothetical protein
VKSRSKKSNDPDSTMSLTPAGFDAYLAAGGEMCDCMIAGGESEGARSRPPNKSFPAN